MKKINYLLVAALMLLSQYLHSQTFSILWNSSFPSNPNGPLYTAGPAGMFLNAGGTNSNGGPLSVSASFSNQQYGTLPAGLTGFGDLGMMFGISNNNSAKIPTPNAIGVPIANVGSPLPAYYSPRGTIIGSGVSTFNNYAINMFSSAEGLAGQPTNAKYYLGNVTFTFSRLVYNPVMHVTGLGGFLSINEAPLFPTLPFATDLEVVSTSPGVFGSLTKLSGSSHLLYDVPTKTIKNTFIESEYIVLGHTPEGGDYAGTGSLRIRAAGFINSITFKVYLRGMSAGQVWTSDGTYVNQVYNGDRFNVSFSLPNAPEVECIPGDVLCPLPATGLHLDAALNGNDVSLSWKTQTELNSDHFEIERSTDNINFSQIGNKQASGNSTSTISYAYTDPSMTAPVYYYRLKLVDIDGKSVYSNVAIVRKSGGIKGVKVFPNPVTSQVNIEFSNAKGNYEITLYNQLGQNVINKSVTISSTVQYVKMEKGTLAPGSYLISARNTETNEKYVQNVIFQ